MLNDHIKVPIILLIVGLSSSLTAQIPDNFEFLDHRTRTSYLGVSKVIGDKIYYVSHNNLSPLTTFNVVDGNRNVETLLTLPYDFSNSNLFEVNDTSTVIILDNLIEYDIGTPGYYHIKLSPDTVTIDTLFRDRNDDPIHVSGVIVDSLGRQMFGSEDGIVIVENGKIVDQKRTNNPYRIFHNSTYQLFGLDGNIISAYDGSEFTQRFQLEEGTYSIVDIKSWKSKNYILTRDYETRLFRIQVFNIDFTQNISTIKLPYQVNSLEQVNFYDNEIQAIFSHDDLLEIVSIDSLGNLSSKYTAESKDEFYIKFIPLGNERLLLMGNYGLAFDEYGNSRYSRNIFFRNYSMSEENNYDRVNVSLDDFKLFRTYSDTTSIETYPGTKTFHFGRHDFEMELSIENHGSENISLVNVYSIDNLDDFHPKFHLDYKYAGNISPSEIKTSYYEDSRYLDADILRDSVDIPFFIPGADFKFNENPFWDLEVLVDIEELVEEASFAIYPNPTSSFLNLSFDEALGTIFIYDLNGILVSSDFNPKSKDKIDVSSLPVGSYFVKATIKNQDKYIISKFIKI